jgi:hypothetical protein
MCYPILRENLWEVAAQMDAKRRQQIKAAALFTFVSKRDGNGRASAIDVPGHEGRRYMVLIKRNGHVEVECLQDTPLGDVPCQGGLRSFCFHSYAALEIAAREAGRQVVWCKDEPAAKRLSRVGGNVLKVVGKRSGKVIWGVVK